MQETPTIFDSVKIQEYIPHRYPFLLIDKVIEFVDNERLVAVKNVTINEQFFVGHFPGTPVMPGVLILEAIAQACAILAKASTQGLPPEKLVYLVGADNVKWKKKVIPGDSLHIEVKVNKHKGPFWVLEGQVTVEGKLVASGTITACEG